MIFETIHEIRDRVVTTHPLIADVYKYLGSWKVDLYNATEH
jgi:hypothetical protein